MTEYLNDLNNEQRHAVEYGISEGSTLSGPLLIIAGAGSGKTNTLAYRVAHLIHNGADPQKILLLTFTRRASEEMIKRAMSILVKANAAAQKEGKKGPAVTSMPWSGTFHSVANRLLRIYSDAIGIDASFTVMDRSDSADLLNTIRNDRGFAEKQTRFPKKDTCLAIYSYVVNSLGSVGQALEKNFPWCGKWEKELKQLFKNYAERKRAMNVMDYDDLLLYWFYMVHDEKIAVSVGKRFDHILVDEYQDTNRLQSGILLKIRPEGGGLTVVGDDAQAIYSFRAATFRNIVDFQSHFDPPAHLVTLERNYRSTMPILRASNAVMEQAGNRFIKNLFSNKQSGEKPFLVTVEDEDAQAGYVADTVLNYRESGSALRDQAVLFRSSHHSAALEIELGKRNIPFVKFGGLKFLEAAHIKDVVATLRWIENPRDTIASFRVLQLMDGVGPAGAMKMVEYLEGHAFDFQSLQAFDPPPATKPHWPALCKVLCTLRKEHRAWAGQAEMVRAWYLPHFERIYDANPSREKDLEQLVQLAAKFPSREKFLSDLALNPPDVTSDEAENPLLDEDYLILSTIHSAKGQEWKVVYILNVADGWIPSDMATEDAEQIEEERRLLYVAMTRAKDHLHLSYPARFYRYGFKHQRADTNMFSIRSRFITDDMLDHFKRESFGKAADVDGAGEAHGEKLMDIGEKVCSFWS